MRLEAFFFCISLGGFFANATFGQDAAVRSRELVRALAQANWGDQVGLDPCSYEKRYRSLAESLVQLGAEARVNIEPALDSIEQRGDASEFATNGAWVVYVYARIWGRDAYPRLQRIAHNPALVPLKLDVDNSIAVSLGLTGFVSSAGPLGRSTPCGGITDPQDVLSRFIRAWQRNDRHWIETGLGPNAKKCLHAMLLNRPWENFRAELWPRRSDGSTAVGYRFDTVRNVSQPVGAPIKQSDANYGEELGRVAIDTQFFDGFGKSCGESSVTFAEYFGDRGHRFYVLDNLDLSGLMRLIAGCAAE